MIETAQFLELACQERGLSSSLVQFWPFVGPTAFHILELVENNDYAKNYVDRIYFDRIFKCIKFRINVLKELHTFFYTT